MVYIKSKDKKYHYFLPNAIEAHYVFKVDAERTPEDKDWSIRYLPEECEESATFDEIIKHNKFREDLDEENWVQLRIAIDRHLNYTPSIEDIVNITFRYYFHNDNIDKVSKMIYEKIKEKADKYIQKTRFENI